MQPWIVRDFHADDLDQLVSVWQSSRTEGVHPAVVAAVQGRVVGAAACRA